MIRAPIFIVGSPRSGTSLLRRCLNQHPRLAICGETHFFSLVWFAERFGDLRSAESRHRLVEHFREAAGIYFHHSIDLCELSDRLSRDATSYRRFFQIILREYARQQGKVRCGEKSPEHALHLPFILSQFPDGQILHIVRDPRDVAASLMTLPHHSSDVITNALTWRRHVRAADSHQGRPYYLRIHYEELVRSPGPVFQRICRFLDEPPFDEWSVAFDPSPPNRFWWLARSFQPISTARIGRWRSDLSSEQVALIEWIGGSAMQRLGYVKSQVLHSGWLSGRAIAREFIQFCLFQVRLRWKRTVAWRMDPRPLLFWTRDMTSDGRFQQGN